MSYYLGHVQGSKDAHDAAQKRTAELEAAIREMILSLPGGSVCDPQEVADALREIAMRHGVKIED